MNMDEIRQEIDKADSEMAALFKHRMELCAQIAEKKAQCGLPIFNPEREKAMLASCGAELPPELAPFYRELLQKEISLSKRRQRSLLRRLPENITVSRGCLSEIGRLFDLNRRVLLVTDSGVPAEYAKNAAAQCHQTHKGCPQYRRRKPRHCGVEKETGQNKSKSLPSTQMQQAAQTI